MNPFKLWKRFRDWHDRETTISDQEAFEIIAKIAEEMKCQVAIIPELGLHNADLPKLIPNNPNLYLFMNN